MLKKTLALLVYTLIVIIISSIITWFYMVKVVLAPSDQDGPSSLRQVTAEQVANSPIKEGDVVEIFSYACHYCAQYEKDIEQMEKGMPAGKRFVRIHLTTDPANGLSQFAPVFATLQVMGIEDQMRQKAYDAILKQHINLANGVQREKWLKDNGIDVDTFNQTRNSQEVKDLLAYMQRIVEYYDINATPSFIINKKWITFVDRGFPAYAKHVYSMLLNDKPLEK